MIEKLNKHCSRAAVIAVLALAGCEKNEGKPLTCNVSKTVESVYSVPQERKADCDKPYGRWTINTEKIDPIEDLWLDVQVLEEQIKIAGYYQEFQATDYTVMAPRFEDEILDLDKRLVEAKAADLDTDGLAKKLKALQIEGQTAFLLKRVYRAKAAGNDERWMYEAAENGVNRLSDELGPAAAVPFWKTYNQEIIGVRGKQLLQEAVFVSGND